jgi:UDPglucose 6-dehydrogenase
LNVGVVGAGHVGLVLSAGLAELGHTVTAVDRQPVVDEIASGRNTFYEPGLGELVRRHLVTGRLSATAELRAMASKDVVWIVVGTHGATGSLHFDNLHTIIPEILEICSGAAVAIKSTLPLGACAALMHAYAQLRSVLVYNPEFLREGSALEDFFNPGKIVVGSEDPVPANRVLDAFCSLPGLRVSTDVATAELIKLAQNAFNALRVSFVNELQLATAQTGGSLETTLRALRDDSTLHRRYLRPGFAYGGSCLATSVVSLIESAASGGYPAPLLRAVEEVNETRILSLVKELRRRVGSLHGRTVAVWGLGYKDDTDDTRNAPALKTISILSQEGALVRIYDPVVTGGSLPRNCKRVRDAESSLKGADALLIFTAGGRLQSDAVPLRARLPADRVFDLTRGGDRASPPAG